MDVASELERLAVGRNGIIMNGKQDKGQRLSRDFALSLIVAVVGFYVPKLFLPSQDQLDSRVIPYQQTASGDEILDFELNHPLVDPPTIPSKLLVYTGLWLPLAIVFFACWKSPHRQDLQAGLSGLLTAIGVSEACTTLLKLYVSRRRPNFYALCGWSSKQLKCTGPYLSQVEAQLSFPSGHSSLSFCAMTFLVLLFLGKLGLRRNEYSVSRRFLAFCSCVIPWGWAALVGASRIVDWWHHPSDVIAGTMLGSLVAVISYHCVYPPVTSTNAGVPLLASSVSSEKLPSFHE
jgi:diacylglycerol diphosphate phosphatase/phosphatidate phosphatase